MTVSAIPVCRICGASARLLVSREVSEAPESAVYRCADCDLVYLDPIMSEAEEAAFYLDQFERYMEGRSGAGWKSPETHFQSYQSEATRRWPLVEPYVQPTDRVLEVGSSTGFFLDRLTRHVAAVTGVEPSEAYRLYANSRGLETVDGLAALGDRQFEVILLYYVLEHLRDPIGYLRQLSERLAPGGRLLIEVPNVEDALLSVYAVPSFGPFYWQKAHYQNFSHRTLAAILEQAGYTTELIPVQRYDLSNHMVWMLEGRPGGFGRYRHLLTADVDATYAEALKRQWVCDTIYAVARRRAQPDRR
jgi:SAM-dependent methyltransferase